MKKNKLKIIIAWIILIVLTVLFLLTNYVKFFYINDQQIEEEIETSTSEAIETALTDITTNFNADPLIETYKNEGINIKAVLNNYSLFISYYDGTTITYEFTYNKLKLNINITNEEENLKKFNKIYEILLKSIQKRIGNEENIGTIINEHINEFKEYDGIIKTIDEKNNIIKYNIDITKKLIKEGE